MANKTARPLPLAKPREPLTAKRKAAIFRYVVLTTKKLPVLYFGVEQTLKAEKMPSERLYQWLQSKGYKWCPKSKIWTEK